MQIDEFNPGKPANLFCVETKPKFNFPFALDRLHNLADGVNNIADCPSVVESDSADLLRTTNGHFYGDIYQERFNIERLKLARHTPRQFVKLAFAAH